MVQEQQILQPQQALPHPAQVFRALLRKGQPALRLLPHILPQAGMETEPQPPLHTAMERQMSHVRLFPQRFPEALLEREHFQTHHLKLQGLLQVPHITIAQRLTTHKVRLME